jgi:phospholipase C
MTMIDALREIWSRPAIAAALCGLSAALPLPAKAGIPEIKHVIIVVQENRTVDNLFHGLNAYLPKADIANSGLTSKGKTVPLTPIPLVDGYDLDHSHTAFTLTYNKGKMDGADRIICVGYFQTCPIDAPYRYVRPGDVRSYFEIAKNYGFANRMFQSNQGPSYPAHQFLFGGTSQIEAYSPYFAANNTQGGTGCIAPVGSFVPAIDPLGHFDTRVYPCFEHQTLADLLDAPPNNPTHPLSWRYYTLGEQHIWSAPDSIRHLCNPAGVPPHCTDVHWTNGDIVLWPPQVLIDIQSHALSTVSWVIPSAQDSDHPAYSDGGGPSWVASIVNAIGKSSYWTNTAILIVWDDWGGWYDHVKPPIDPTYGYYEYGFRVPFLVVSAYTPKGYVSQTQHDFGSILRFVETAFDLGLIPPGNFVDARADDLSDFFDFTKPPRKFTPVTQTVPNSRFLDRSRPMEAPDTDD